MLIDFETILYGRPWYDWQQWFNAMQLRAIKGTGWLRFSHYDQVIEAARNSSGVAVGKWPHLAEHVRDGVLVAPLGASGIATVGAFYLEVADSAPKEAADAFVDWLRRETRRDNEARQQRGLAIASGYAQRDARARRRLSD